MESCVCYLLMNHVIKEGDGSIAFDISTYIKEHLSQRLTAKELCEKFKISRNMLYRISETYFGMPIAEYVNLTRIEKAKERLREGVGIEKISEMTGFCDYVCLGKMLKKATGVTPGAFATR